MGDCRTQTGLFPSDRRKELDGLSSPNRWIPLPPRPPPEIYPYRGDLTRRRRRGRNHYNNLGKPASRGVGGGGGRAAAATAEWGRGPNGRSADRGAAESGGRRRPGGGGRCAATRRVGGVSRDGNPAGAGSGASSLPFPLPTTTNAGALAGGGERRRTAKGAAAPTSRSPSVAPGGGSSRPEWDPNRTDLGRHRLSPESLRRRSGAKREGLSDLRSFAVQRRELEDLERRLEREVREEMEGCIPEEEGTEAVPVEGHKEREGGQEGGWTTEGRSRRARGKGSGRSRAATPQPPFDPAGGGRQRLRPTERVGPTGPGSKRQEGGSILPNAEGERADPGSLGAPKGNSDGDPRPFVDPTGSSYNRFISHGPGRGGEGGGTGRGGKICGGTDQSPRTTTLSRSGGRRRAARKAQEGEGAGSTTTAGWSAPARYTEFISQKIRRPTSANDQISLPDTSSGELQTDGYAEGPVSPDDRPRRMYETDEVARPTNDGPSCSDGPRWPSETSRAAADGRSESDPTLPGALFRGGITSAAAFDSRDSPGGRSQPRYPCGEADADSPGVEDISDLADRVAELNSKLRSLGNGILTGKEIQGTSSSGEVGAEGQATRGESQRGTRPRKPCRLHAGGNLLDGGGGDGVIFSSGSEWARVNQLQFGTRVQDGAEHDISSSRINTGRPKTRPQSSSHIADQPFSAAPFVADNSSLPSTDLTQSTGTVVDDQVCHGKEPPDWDGDRSQHRLKSMWHASHTETGTQDCDLFDDFLSAIVDSDQGSGPKRGALTVDIIDDGLPPPEPQSLPIEAAVVQAAQPIHPYMLPLNRRIQKALLDEKGEK